MNDFLVIYSCDNIKKWEVVRAFNEETAKSFVAVKNNNNIEFISVEPATNEEIEIFSIASESNEQAWFLVFYGRTDRNVDNFIVFAYYFFGDNTKFNTDNDTGIY